MSSSSFQSRFSHAAISYAAYRPQYPDELFERILAALPAECRRLAMDLGAGTGNSVLPLRAHFDQIIAVEPDSLMAEKLRASDPRIALRIVSAEECEQEAESVDLITIGAALHWMDAWRVIEKALTWLRTKGLVAIWAGGLPRTPEPVAAVTRQELADRWRRFRDSRLDLADNSSHARRVVSRFTIIEERDISNIVWLSPNDFANFWRSASYASAYARELAMPDSYWRDLETRYALAWPRGKIPVDFSLWLLLARKD